MTFSLFIFYAKIARNSKIKKSKKFTLLVCKHFRFRFLTEKRRADCSGCLLKFHKIICGWDRLFIQNELTTRFVENNRSWKELRYGFTKNAGFPFTVPILPGTTWKHWFPRSPRKNRKRKSTTQKKLENGYIKRFGITLQAVASYNFIFASEM